MNDDVKACCAKLYESDFARLLLGDSFHPGGLRLTARLGEQLQLDSHSHVLDVACGKGESAIFLARRFACRVTGIDFGAVNVHDAAVRAENTEVAQLLCFRQGDAESLPFADGSFDAVLCECAFCTFPEKCAAALEFARVLKTRGRIALSDLTRSGELPEDLRGLLAWVACIADARPTAEYVSYLESAAFTGINVEPQDHALAEMVHNIQGKLLSVELMSKLQKLDLGGIDLAQAKSLAKAASEAVRTGLLGYAIVTGERV